MKSVSSVNQLVNRFATLINKYAQSQTSQSGEIEKVVKDTGLFPVKYGSTSYDKSHPLHAKIMKILDDNSFPDKIDVSYTVTPNSQISFIVTAPGSEHPQVAKVCSQIKSLFDSLVPKISAEIKKIPPPGENITLSLFTL
jgi:hypothetical protein